MIRSLEALLRIALALLLAVALGNGAQARGNETSSTAVEQRRVEALQLALERPFPKTTCPKDADPGNACIWGKLGHSIAALYLARSNADVAAANSAVREAIVLLGGLPQELAVHGRAPNNKRAKPTDRLMFFTAGLLERVYFQFRPGSSGPFAGRLTADNARAIERLMWDHARDACRLSDADPTKTWDFKYSENISLFHDTTCWGMAEILSANPICAPCTYEDGSTLQQQLAAWTKFLTEYIRQRAKYGGLVEFFSPTYYKYTLQNLYNLSDFASDPQLRRLASAFLDVWWTEWAQEQVGGWHGGSKARAIATEIENQTVGTELGWFYFGLGQAAPPGMVVSMIASSYRPPDIVNEIATDPAGRGSYIVRSQTGGLLTRADGREINAAGGGIVRYAYVTPAFILALAEVPKVPWERWIPFSRQNRWSGITMMGANRPQYVFARPLFNNADKVRSYNDLWGVQSVGTQIVQKIQAPLSRNAGRMAVWLSDALKGEREGEWTFVTWGQTYVAFRPAFGAIAAANTSNQFVLNDETSPVIIQTASKSEFPDLASFKAAVRSAPLEVKGEYVRFTGLGKAGAITFFYKSDRLPEIDGKPVDLTPPFEFDSPFLQARWGEGVVTIRKGQHELIRDFR